MNKSNEYFWIAQDLIKNFIESIPTDSSKKTIISNYANILTFSYTFTLTLNPISILLSANKLFK